MRIFWFFQLAVLLPLISVISLTGSWQQGASMAVGWSVMMLALALHQLVWAFLFHKKLIAPGLGIIVFKYALLAAALYNILQITWLNLTFLLVGLVGFVMTTLIGALVYFKMQSESDGATGRIADSSEASTNVNTDKGE